MKNETILNSEEFLNRYSMGYEKEWDEVEHACNRIFSG